MAKKNPDNFVRFTDQVSFKPIVPDQIRDFYATHPAASTSLRIGIAATHAGLTTRNNGFYLPSKMRAGTASWTDQFNKPILIHHDSHNDAIGRVYKASYIDISEGFRHRVDATEVKDHCETAISSALLDAFIEGKLSFSESFDIASRYFIEDAKVVDDPSYEGLGYIELIADISDPDAAKKVVDGRYLTGSVGASTNQAVCSVCKQDWAEDEGPCDHKPGQIYDGKKAVLIAGDLVYDEYSFVNKPADRHSRVIEVNIAGVQDFVHLDNDVTLGLIPEVGLIIDSYQQQDLTKEDVIMTFENAFKLASEKYKDVENLKDMVTKLIDEHKDLEEEKFFQLLDEQITPKNTETQDEENPVKLFWGDEYDEIVGEDGWGVEYAAMVADALQGDLKEDEDIVSLKDAKLTADSRKKLADSVFCGPNRSYPVNDRAHAKSAMAYAKKNEVETSVVDCITRKAKRLGCTFEDEVKDTIVEVSLGQFILDYFDHFSDGELTQLYNGILGAMSERGVEHSCDTKPLEDRIAELENQLKDSKTVSDKNAEDAVKAVEDKLETGRKENGYLHKDVDTLEDSLAKAVEEIRSLKIQRVADFHCLAGEEVQLNELKEKSTEILDETLKDLDSKVDIVKIADKLNSGLSNNPAGMVDDPTAVQDNTGKTKVKDEKRYDRNVIEQVAERFLKLRMGSGQAIADRYLKNAQAKGLVPIENPVKE